MTIDGAIDLLRAAMILSAQVAGPMLMAALVVGLVVGVFQTATQINEASISYLAKVIAVGVTLVTMGPYALSQVTDYTRQTYRSIGEVVR